jgi:hypothetical protein
VAIQLCDQDGFAGGGSAAGAVPTALTIVSVAVGVPVTVVGLELIAVGQTIQSTESNSLIVVGALLAIGGSLFALIGGVTGFSSIGHTRLSPAAGETSSLRPSLRLTGVGLRPAPHDGLMAGATFSF